MFSRFFVSTLLATTALSSPLKRRANVFQIGSKWQIDISNDDVVSAGNLVPDDAAVWDIDLFNTPAETIAQIKAQGKQVICYFSAGTSENWRPDFGDFQEDDQGADLPDWPGERWLNLRSENVWNIQERRIQMAAEKGCDAIDPDNMDGYSNENGGGLSPPLTQEDSIAFLGKMADAASSLGMSTGLKNAMDILPSVQDSIAFAVNEECEPNSECSAYDSFLSSGKPVFHIEYGSASQAPEFCLEGSEDGASFSTVIKNLDLDLWAAYCDGSTTGGSGGGDGDNNNDNNDDPDDNNDDGDDKKGKHGGH